MGWGSVMVFKIWLMINIYHFVTCNPPTLLLRSLFAMTFSFSGTVGLLIIEIIVSLRTVCDRVTRWLSPFRLSIRYYLIVTGFSGLVELPSSAPILVGWADYGRLWLKWSLGYLVLIKQDSILGAVLLLVGGPIIVSESQCVSSLACHT